MLVNDVSGSMRAEDVDPDRLTAAVESAKVLLDKTPDNFRLGLVTFSDYAQQIVAPTTDRGAVTGALERMEADGGTAMGDGLARGLVAAQTPVPTQDGKGTRKLPAILVLLSDGKNTLGSADPLEVARQAKEARIPIYAIALGHRQRRGVQQDPFGFTQRIPVPPDKETLREIATHHGRPLLRGREHEGRRVDLQPHRHPADVTARAARDHRGLRGRRVRAARAGRGALARLVRPPTFVSSIEFVQYTRSRWLFTTAT